MAIRPRPQLDEIPLPPQPGLLGGWGQKLEATLQRFVIGVYNVTIGHFMEAVDKAIRYLFDSIEDELKPVILPFLDEFDAQDNLPEPFRRMSEHIRHSEPITFSAIAVTIIVSAIVGFAMGMIRPFQQLAANKANAVARPTRLDAPAAFAAWRRGAISEEEFIKHCRQHGWPDIAIDAFLEIFAQRVGVGDLSTLLLRQEMSESEFDAELAKRGYKSDEVAKLKELQKVIPGLGDIIRMAVREAFTPEVVRQFQLHAELPGEMVEWAAKQGLSREWAEAFWAAHWELPSLTMGFEMLHRGEISEDEMRLLIRTHDVSPFWRDKLLNISYSPYTRVDIRRMHAAGVVGVEEVYQNYRDLGYDHEKATKMTEFTVAYNQSTERDLTKTDLLNALKIGYFGPEQTRANLIALGYDENEADYYVSKVLYDLWQDEIQEQVKYLQQQYVRNLISQNDVYSELGRLNLPAEQINRYLRTWDIEREAKTRLLTSTKLEQLRKAQIIDDGTYSEEMSGLGYKQQYIEWLLDLIHTQMGA
jgi:hypothetical protein